MRSDAPSLAIAACIASEFFIGVTPDSKNARRSSTCFLRASPKTVDEESEKQSIREAIVHLFANVREIRPLFRAPAREINEE